MLEARLTAPFSSVSAEINLDKIEKIGRLLKELGDLPYVVSFKIERNDKGVGMIHVATTPWAGTYLADQRSSIGYRVNHFNTC